MFKLEECCPFSLRKFRFGSLAILPFCRQNRGSASRFSGRCVALLRLLNVEVQIRGNSIWGLILRGNAATILWEKLCSCATGPCLKEG